MAFVIFSLIDFTEYWNIFSPQPLNCSDIDFLIASGGIVEVPFHDRFEGLSIGHALMEDILVSLLRSNELFALDCSITYPQMISLWTKSFTIFYVDKCIKNPQTYHKSIIESQNYRKVQLSLKTWQTGHIKFFHWLYLLKVLGVDCIFWKC